jgi:hypothetical protein
MDAYPIKETLLKKSPLAIPEKLNLSSVSVWVSASIALSGRLCKFTEVNGIESWLNFSITRLKLWLHAIIKLKCQSVD